MLEAKIAGIDTPVTLPETEEAPVRIPLSNLVPDADYTFTVALKSGEKLEGETKTTYHSPPSRTSTPTTAWRAHILASS